MRRLQPLFLLAALALPLAAQNQTPRLYGTEVFVTMNQEQAALPWTTDWDNFILVGPNDDIEVIDFNHGQTGTTSPPPFAFNIGVGTFGNLYEHGSYIYEPFWFTQATGNVGGFIHPTIDPFSPNGPAFSDDWFERTSGLQPLQRQGLRITRADGRPFWLKSMEYRDAHSDFEFGLELQTYLSFANYASFIPVPNLSTWTPITFQPLPPDMRRMNLGPGSDATLVFDVAQGTVSAQGVISSWLTGNGGLMDTPTLDPLIGGTFLFSADYTGTDLTDLTDVVFTNVAITLQTPGGPSLSLSTALPLREEEYRLVGTPAAFPESFPVFKAASGGTVTGSPGGSPALQSLEIRLPLEPLALVMAMGPSGPRILEIRKDYHFVPHPQFLMAPTPQGGLAYGIVGLPPGEEIFSIFDVNPPQPLGTGPVAGINFGPAQYSQVLQPVGTDPFHVTADGHGTYFFGLPSLGALAGLTLDLLLVEQPDAQTFWVSPPVRVTL